MSPHTARWQQQINSSFEALVNTALLSPHSEDCSDWRYTVEDQRGISLTMDDLQRKDWSLRHLEQRSDSRDSGLESDAAADRNHVCLIEKPQVKHSIEDRHSQHALFALQHNPPLVIDALALSDSPAQNRQLYGVLGKKKLHSALKMQRPVTDDQLTNGFTSYSSHIPDASGPTVPRHHFSVSPLCDVSKTCGSKSACFTR